jgi:hypothetical protein
MFTFVSGIVIAMCLQNIFSSNFTSSSDTINEEKTSSASDLKNSNKECLSLANINNDIPGVAERFNVYGPVKSVSAILFLLVVSSIDEQLIDVLVDVFRQMLSLMTGIQI